MWFRRLLCCTAAASILPVSSVVVLSTTASGASASTVSPSSQERLTSNTRPTTMTSTTLSALSSVSAHRASNPSNSRISDSTITCTLSIASPHRSTHNPAVVNVVATWKCDANVASLSMTVKLYTFAGVQQASDSFKNSGKQALKGHAASVCIPDFYYGTARGTVVFPAGYSPHSRTLNVQSKTVLVLCI